MSRFFSYFTVTLVAMLTGYDVALDVMAPKPPAVLPKVPDQATVTPPTVEPVVIPDYRADLPTSLEVLNFSGLDAYRQQIQSDIDDADYHGARAKLLELAYNAVESADNNALGNALALLGEVALLEKDLNSAEVYLLESLALFEQAGNQTNRAWVYMQLGKVHVTSRQLARKAGQSYDQLLIARNQISRYQYHSALDHLNQVIQDSLEIDRYGTAASAFETLAGLRSLQGETHEAEKAIVEAARLYASSGQVILADTILNELAPLGTDPELIRTARIDVENRGRGFEKDVNRIRRAQDYEQLYNHYHSSGQTLHAWKFRLQAADALARTSRQVMYHRQPGVLAVLYNSNIDIDRARDYLNLANTLFTETGTEHWKSQTNEISRLIF